MEKVSSQIGKKRIKNKSFSYILPLCGDNYKDFETCLGCFVGSTLTPDLDKKIYLLYNTDYSQYSYHDDWLCSHNLFYDKFSVTEDYVMYIFNLPRGYEHIYDLFINGKYSKLDDEYKNHIIHFYKDHFETDNMKDVLYKSEKLRKKWEERIGQLIPKEMEVASIPNKEQEFFDISMIKNEKQNNTWI